MEGLEIRVQSTYGLKDQNTFGKMNPYVTVALSTDPTSKQKTEVHTFGGTNPKWKGKPLRFALNEDMCKKHNTRVVFKIMAEKPLGDREVGEVIVLVKELLQTEQMEKSLSCNVSTPSGRSQGTLSFSYKVVKNVTTKNVCEPNVADDHRPDALGTGPTGYEPDMYPPPHAQPQYEVAAPHPPPHAQPQYEVAAPYPPPHAQPQYEVAAPYPPPHAQPQYGVAAPYPPPSQHYQQPAGYSPPIQLGYSPNQKYVQQPPGAYAYPSAGAPTPIGQYAYPCGPGYPSASRNQPQKREVVKQSKLRKGLFAALGSGAAGLVSAMVLGDIGPGLVEMASGLGGAVDNGGTYQTAYYPHAGSYYIDLTDHCSSIGSAIG